jgi:hypothetical protein
LGPHLECNAHALPPLVKYWAAAVASVDGCVNLHTQQVDGAMAVLSHLQQQQSMQQSMQAKVQLNTVGEPPL